MENSLIQKELESYSRAGDVADEVLASIRTVTAFGGEAKELQRYNEQLRLSVKSGQKKGIYAGLSNAFMWLLTYWSYAVAFWYGAYLIVQDREKENKVYTPASLMIILFCVLDAIQSYSMSTPHMEAFAMAKPATKSILSVIDRKSKIDPLCKAGLRPTNIRGNIEFKNVHFRYPARINVNILNGLNLKIEEGQTVALVGPSGCGKSTCLQLIQRLYDVTEVFHMNTQDMRDFPMIVVISISDKILLFTGFNTFRGHSHYGDQHQMASFVRGSSWSGASSFCNHNRRKHSIWMFFGYNGRYSECGEGCQLP